LQPRSVQPALSSILMSILLFMVVIVPTVTKLAMKPNRLHSMVGSRLVDAGKYGSTFSDYAAKHDPAFESDQRVGAC